MSKGTIISWTNETWNPVTGCHKISPGCKNCYAENLSLKRGWSAKPWTARNIQANLVLHPERLRKPFNFKPGTRAFTNSMSDLGHPAIPLEFTAKTFEVMNACRHVTFQILTKRPETILTWPREWWTPNIWMGVSVEDHKNGAYRLDLLRKCAAKTKWVSFEPLLGSVLPMSMEGLHWAVVGGESGPGYRPMDHQWAREIRDECVKRSIPYFFKQDAAFQTEVRCWLVEEDGSCWRWEQYPHEPLKPPTLVEDPKREAFAKFRPKTKKVEAPDVPVGQLRLM